MSNGYTKVPDPLFDSLIDAPGVLTRKGKILLYIIRQTYGFNRRSVRLDSKLLSKLTAKTGISGENLYRLIKGLEKQGALTCENGKEVRISDKYEKHLLSDLTVNSTVKNDTVKNDSKNCQNRQQISVKNDSNLVSKMTVAISNNLIKYNNNTNNITNTSTDNITYTPSSSGIKTQPESPPQEETFEEKRRRVAEEWEQTKRKIAAIEAARTKRGDDDGQSGK